MAVHKITAKWTKILDKQPREVTLLITFPDIYWKNWFDIPIYLRLGDGEADMLWGSHSRGTVIQLPVPANTAVYARAYMFYHYISCTIIKEMEEE